MAVSMAWFSAKLCAASAADKKTMRTAQAGWRGQPWRVIQLQATRWTDGSLETWLLTKA